MRPFDKVIGYEKVKEELIQICDILKNKEVYETLGARMPSGVLLYGEPGLGKTLIAQCFIEEAGLMTYTLRKNKGNGDFIDEISDTFKKAAQNAPAIIFLDDMDKFANEDEDHLDAEEYVAVQTGIDEVKNKNVFVIATVNDIRKLPASLSRAGRFDRKIRMTAPDEGDAVKIVSHYLQDKNISDDVDIKDLVKLIGYDSCAGLETILNEAAINAGYERRKIIEMKDFVKATLGLIVPDEEKPEECDSEELFDMAVHEAGHLVVMEILEPGRAGMAMVRLRGHKAGAVKESTAETTRLTRYARYFIVILTHFCAMPHVKCLLSLSLYMPSLLKNLHKSSQVSSCQESKDSVLSFLESMLTIRLFSFCAASRFISSFVSSFIDSTRLAASR